MFYEPPDSKDWQMKLRISVILGISAALLNLDAAAETENATRPNVVVMRVDDMGFAGSSIARDPNPVGSKYSADARTPLKTRFSRLTAHVSQPRLRTNGRLQYQQNR